MRIRGAAIISVLIIFVSSSVSFCADIEKEKQDEWFPPSTGPITTWSTPLCEAGRLLAQGFFFYNRTRGVFDDKGHYKSFKNKETKSQYQETLFLQYGLTDRLDVNAQGTYQQNLRHANGIHASDTGFGDTYLFARYCIIKETKWLPNITALFQFKIPTGKHEKLDEGKLDTDLMGSTWDAGAYDHGYGIILIKRLKPFILYADFAYVFPVLSRTDGVKVSYGNYVYYDFAAEYFFYKGFNLMLECNWLKQGDRRDNGSLVPGSDKGQMVICPGIGWSNEKVHTLLAYQRTLAGTNVDVNDSIIFTVELVF